MALVLRMLIVAQIVCVALLGAAIRGTLTVPWVREWAETAAYLCFYPVLVGFPVAVSRRVSLPQWKRDMILGIEVALGFATLIAILPAVQ
jgi:hypothetical protein